MDSFYIQHEFCAAANTLRIPVLKSMKAPVEIRPEGTLTAVTRGLFTEGEVTNSPNHHKGIAPGLFLQFYNEFQKLKPKYLAFHSADSYELFDAEKGVSEQRYSIRFAYIK